MKKSKTALITLFFTLALSALHSPSAQAQVAVPIEVQAATPVEIKLQMIRDLQRCLLQEEYVKAKRALTIMSTKGSVSILEMKKLEARSCAVVAQRALRIGMTEDEIRIAILSRYRIPQKNLSDEAHEGGSHTGFVQDEKPQP